ncbi:hypothetical protein STTU_0794 [Streptomyces sp. Tu6071]|nr:hypothetical protein STTU_0794 [Streptomyces sp. Tu6071]
MRWRIGGVRVRLQFLSTETEAPAALELHKVRKRCSVF